MRFEVRLKINGASFDPHAFVGYLPLEDAGEVRQYIGQKIDQEKFGRIFWMSSSVEVFESPEAACVGLLSHLYPHLKAARNGGGEISLQVSAYYRNGDEHRGSFAPSQLVHLLNGIDASLDYSPEIDVLPARA